MSAQQAYALRADHEGFVGGQLAWGAGQQTFDVGEELSKNGGVIITEDELLKAALNDYPALKQVSLGEAHKQASQAAKERAKSIPKQQAQKAVHSGDTYDEATLQALDKPDLEDLADDLDVPIKSDTKKDDIVQAILNHQKEAGA